MSEERVLVEKLSMDNGRLPCAALPTNRFAASERANNELTAVCVLFFHVVEIRDTRMAHIYLYFV